MEIIGIAEEALTFAIESAAQTHPREFMARLRSTDAEELDIEGEGKVLTEVMLLPGTQSSPVHAEAPEYATPIGGRGDGSVHSHPNGVLKPSDTDIRSFSSGVHIIVGPPYDLSSWKAFDAQGEEVELDVLDVELPEPDEVW